MKKTIRYLLNTILFVVLWGIQSAVVIGFSFEYIRVGPSAPIAIGGIVALFTSYKLVKKINRLKLDSIVFIVLLISGLISFLYFQFGGALEDTKDYNF